MVQVHKMICSSSWPSDTARLPKVRTAATRYNATGQSQTRTLNSGPAGPSSIRISYVRPNTTCAQDKQPGYMLHCSEVRCKYSGLSRLASNIGQALRQSRCTALFHP